ncbi:MAG: hypothetical protein ACRD04_06110 [Terriglobales bacterium]
MAEKTERPAVTQPVVHVPGMQPVPYVAITLPDGTVALRHPSELQKTPSPAKMKGGK